MFNLLRYFTISSLIACVVASLILGIFYRRTAEADLITLAESRNVALLQAIANSLWPQISPMIAQTEDGDSAQTIARLRQALDIQTRGSSVLKIKVYDLNGRTVFSSDASEIGEDRSINPGFQAARHGQVLSELSHGGLVDGFDGALADRDLLNTYIPIYDNDTSGDAIAVIEIYSDITALLTRINDTQRRVVTGLVLAFGVLYGVLWLVVRYASGILRQQYSDIVQAEWQLQHEKTVLEQRVADRTMALRDTNLQLERELYARKQAQANQRRVGERLQALRQIDQEILAAKLPEMVAQIALRHLRSLIPCRRASLTVFDYEAHEGIILAVNADHESAYLFPNTRVPFYEFELLDEFQHGGSANATTTIYETTAADWRLRHEGVTRYAQVPLIMQDVLVGVLELGIGPDDELLSEHFEIAHEAANSLAIAVQQARLHEQVQFHAHELQLRVEELNEAKLALETERTSLARRVESRTAELSTANTELARASRLKDEFLAAMSHELRTPLHAILSYAELLQEGIYGSLNDKQRKSLRDLETVGQHLLALINDLLDVSRIEADKLDLDFGQVQIATICEASLRFVQQSAAAKDLQLVTHFDKRLTTMAGDERRLTQILTNLLNNAIKFTPSGGQIGLDVAYDQTAHAVNFVVWDSGIGIPPEETARIFLPFVQLDARLARNYPGAGLGLALVCRLAKLHGGDVKVESEVGQGSRFTVSIPLQSDQTLKLEDSPSLVNNGGQDNLPAPDWASAAQEIVTPSTPPSAPTNGHYFATPTPTTKDNSPLLLVGEDNEINRKTLVDFLEYKGYTVVEAQDGQAVIDMAELYNPTLLLVDVQMPVLDGLSAIRQLRAGGNDKPIIALTGLAMQGDEQRCLNAGATAYLTKPISLHELVVQIERQLQAAQTYSMPKPTHPAQVSVKELG